MPDKQVQRGPVGQRGVERATHILRLLAEFPTGVSLSDLARETEVPLTTAFRIVGVLRDAGLVRETPSGLLAPGVQTVILAGAFLNGLDVRAEARPAMQRLVDKTGETCHLGVLAVAQIVYLDKIDSVHPVRMASRVGGTNPALTTAIGLSVLAHSDPEAIDQVVEMSKRMYGVQTSRRKLNETLDQIVQQGYATDLEVNERGICCVGAPLFAHTGEVIGGISVTTPATRFDRHRVRDLGRLVRDEADRVSVALGWAPGQGSVWRSDMS